MFIKARTTFLTVKTPDLSGFTEQKLTIQGFKSYRDQVVVDPFSQGVNVVVCASRFLFQILVYMECRWAGTAAARATSSQASLDYFHLRVRV